MNRIFVVVIFRSILATILGIFAPLREEENHRY